MCWAQSVPWHYWLVDKPLTSQCLLPPAAAAGEDRRDADEDVDGVQIDADRTEGVNITMKLTVL